MSDTTLLNTLTNSDAERAVLGSILIDPDSLHKVNWLSPKDFFEGKHRLIFQAMCDLDAKRVPIDFVTLVDSLHERESDAQSWATLEVADLMSSTPTAMYVDHYADIVRKNARLRRLVGTAEKIAKASFESNADPDALIERSIAALERMATDSGSDKVSDMRAIMERQMDRLSRAMDAYEAGTPMGLHTGWYLDNIVGGFQEGNVITIAARPGAGKSSFGIALLLQLAQRGFGGAYVSLEMSEAELVDKMVANLTGINSLQLRNGQLDDREMTRWIDAANTLSQMPMTVIDHNCATLAEIKRQLRTLKQTQNLRFAVIDYIQLMAAGPGDDIGRGENRVQVMSAISRGVKLMAKELDIVIFMVSQLNRGVEARTDKRPLMSDLRESGSIEQDSDVVIMLYRDDYYNEESMEPNVAEVIVAKNRHGDTGMRKMKFMRDVCVFRDYEYQRVALGGSA